LIEPHQIDLARGATALSSIWHNDSIAGVWRRCDRDVVTQMTMIEIAAIRPPLRTPGRRFW
jgi:hypothetical protein